MSGQPIAIHWFRRDLRLEDNTALYHALTRHSAVLPVFIFDTAILDELPEDDRRVSFIHDTLVSLDRRLRALGSGLLVQYGKPEEVWAELLSTYAITAVYTNHDYEPYALQRDEAISKLLAAKGVVLHTFKDHVVRERKEVMKDDGTPYTVYTPYSKRWKATLPQDAYAAFPSEEHQRSFVQAEVPPVLSLQQIGFTYNDPKVPPPHADEQIIRHYHDTRDYPALSGTTRISVHLRFGTVSIRRLMARAQQLNEKYWNELIWREFYQMILWNFPHVVRNAFKKEYDRIAWRNNATEFEAWCQGMTGYPIVDAGMRELNATGYMHNRVRMIVASFLTKDLLIDWRWGEAYFAEKLLDFDLASNNGGWQWAAGCGVDAAPYFRIFNPAEQTRKFDPKGIYIRKWVPELDTMQYPFPIVDHAIARKRTLEAYKVALK